MNELIESEVQKLPLIHGFKNVWRNRYVYIYMHPTDPNKVITMGYALAASGGLTTIPPVICIEDKELYQHILDKKITVVK